MTAMLSFVSTQKVPRFFNTAGPCRPDDHYMLPPTARLPDVPRLISEKMYFVLHAPRQVGKTTALLALAQELTREARYTAVLVSMEVGAPFSHDPGAAELAILDSWRARILVQLPPEWQPPPWPEAAPGMRIGTALRVWSAACAAASRPLVIFLDEIDALADDALIAVLRQLRDGYSNRPQAFPWSLALIGMRDVRDYKVRAGGSDRLRSASPFNVKVESLTLRNFNAAETAQLLTQHTEDTGQQFEATALTRTFDLTQGQPRLVNALARQLTQVLCTDRKQSITVAHVDQAKELLIQRQDTHLDSLAERLREDRVQRIIEPMIAGTTLSEHVSDEDARFVLDVGLCRKGPGGSLVIANPIYQEVIPRVLSQNAQMSMQADLKPTWLDEKGRLDPERLLRAFLDFWRENGEALISSATYHEVAAPLVLMAFLHRVANGGGSIQREYAIGSRRIDLCLRHGDVVLGIELKVWHAKQGDPVAEGLRQLDQYLEGLGQNFGWLVIFDQRPRRSVLSKRLSSKAVRSPGGRQITVVRA